jgi:transposase InsO family protein
MRFAFIQEHRDRWPVNVQCRVLAVARSGYYAWRSRGRCGPGERQKRREALAARIRQVHAENRGVYGSPRVTAELRAMGERVCENTVAKVMRQEQIRARIARRWVPRTTDANHPHPVADNLLGRDFTADAPNRKWACDITYVATGEGWLYLAMVIDLYSRMIVGWSMAGHMRAERVGDALDMAIQRRRPGAGLLHHSDRGVQYACDGYQRLLEENGITCSMSRSGNCYDNAAMESLNGTVKTECVYLSQYATRDQAKRSIFEYIEVFYNRKRRHSSLGYVSPEAFEAAAN